MAVLALAGACSLTAQTTAPGSGDEIDTDDTIVLSPFEVTASEENGYLATETLAGTRIRTDLRDVGAAISVVTKEFMQDIGATDNTTLLQYTTNTEVSGMQGTYAGLGNGASLDESGRLLNPTSANRVRGLSAAENTRDYFVSDIPWDSYNVDRVDIQRGPNSILFGLGKPAGIINASLAGASFRDEGRVDFRVGSYASIRASFNVNKEIIEDVLAIRVAGLWDNEKFQQKPAFEDDERAYVAVRFDPKLFGDSAHTSFKFKYENGNIDANRPRIVTPQDSVSPWFRPVAVSGANPFGGLNKATVPDPYTAWSDYLNAGGASYNPWFGSGGLNAQQPFWLIDGASGTVLDTRAGPINNGARNSDGSIRGRSDGLIGRNYPAPFVDIGSLNGVANSLNLPLANYGQYRVQNMTDAGIFDFYNTLIDGNTKWESEEWDAYNLDFSQTALNDRIGIQLSYDKQEYVASREALLGSSPRIAIDLMESWDDLSANPNVGRAFVTSGAGGNGSIRDHDREYYRASAFGEFRFDDVMDRDSFLTKLLGKHRFNAVYSSEDFVAETRSWNRKANDQAWGAFWNGGDGSSQPFNDRVPVGMIYLGDSLLGVNDASAAHIPGISGNVDLHSGAVNVFDSTWTAGAIYGNDWAVPANLSAMFGDEPEDGWTQASNPANYVGWRYEPIGLWSYDQGADPRLVTGARISQRETESTAISWQGFLWNNAIVTTLGWRSDEVKSRDVTAGRSGYRGVYDLSPANYSLPATYAPNRILEDESMSGGVVLHVNQLFGDRDPLPLNVSFTYNKSSNFEVGNIRNDIYGNPIDNPSGTTKDYGVLLSTKDGRFSFRAVKYESEVKLDNSDLGSGGIGGTIANGLNWRNVFLYDLGAYDWSTREQYSYRNHASNAFPIDGDASLPYHVEEFSAEEAALEDAMISAWNEIQAWMDAKGFFQAWNFDPVPLSVLTTRSQYEANPDAYLPPDTSKVTNYGASAPPGFSVTADTLTKGYEFELTANPTPNWRIAFNASKTQAYRNNVGGETITEWVNYMDSMLLDPNSPNGYTPAGNLPRWGGIGGAIGPSIYSPWRAEYVRLKLQEGTAVPELRKWRFNVVTNYTFREGLLKDVSVGGSYRWQDKVGIGYPLVAIDAANYGFDLDNPIMGPAESSIDLWASYSRKLTEKIDWKVQLNVRNAFASKELIPISVQPDNSTWAGVRIAPNQEWFLTNTFSF